MNTPTAVDKDLADMMSAVFADHRAKHAPGDGAAASDLPLWQQLTELGLVRLTGREESGGSGAGWSEAAELLRAAAWHGVRLPLAEHDLLACWLLESAGLPVDSARRTVCVLDDSGTTHGVPWASAAERIVVLWQQDGIFRAADAEISALTIEAGTNLAGEPRDTVTADPARLSGTPVPDSVVDGVRLRAALVRGLQVCAVLDRILDLTTTHATQRVQFGRPLARFQAVQQLVADIAAEATLARAATEAALATAVRTGWSGAEAEFRIAVARSCAGHAASVVVRNAHQVHGAIGTTREHRLHEFTRPALAWRAEYGSVHFWDDALTTTALTAGPDLWALITS
ncbi:acyl-CoA dehydrogenase family protein [Nocardia rhamnosiphila]|uniref:acyl-CoA dehydrogenase family protein n=1 Tax=Nocardia rhamnosiphila TaxID=426716 RepID=UPI0037A8BE00